MQIRSEAVRPLTDHPIVQIYIYRYKHRVKGLLYNEKVTLIILVNRTKESRSFIPNH